MWLSKTKTRGHSTHDNSIVLFGDQQKRVRIKIKSCFRFGTEITLIFDA